MNERLHFLLGLLFVLFSFISNSQTTTLSGRVTNVINHENVPAVSVTVKGGTQGTFTDENGNFRITVPSLPVVLVFSSVGFENKEVTVDNTSVLQVSLIPEASLGQEVVVSATRTPQRFMESPVTVERINLAAIRNAAAPNFYESITNLKGVDLTTSSLTFRTISTRGFNGSGNLRFNQLIDGMDNQAPGLNFSVGNVIGLSELDVESVELLQGASSALYGSGGMTGTLLMNSKNPFQHKGLSFQIKQGIMHVDKRQRSAAPYYDWAVRWGKQVSDRFAFKIGGQLIAAKDWQAQDYRNLNRNNVFSSLKQGDRTTDPNYDGVNVFGDEASASMNALAQVVRAQVAAGGGTPALTALNGMIAAGMTPQQIATQFAITPPLSPLAQFLPFLIPTATPTVGSNPYRNTFGGQLVSRTGYEEMHLVDYNTYNFKINAGLYYKLTDNIEASLIGNYGSGTTVYTGADRYALRNLMMGQYKIEFKGKNWFARAYTTQENSGDSYTATTAAVAINESWKSNTNWFSQYAGTYGATRLGIVPGSTPGTFLPAIGDNQAHQAARSVADAGRILPGTTAFTNAFNTAISKSISQGGAKFDDATDLYHVEGQVNLTEQVQNLLTGLETLVGASFRQYRLNSNGTIFADTAGVIPINEFGAYVQLQKWLGDVVKLSGSARYDKNENFKGRFTPRFSAVIKVARDNHIRLSYQQAYRFPSTQDQWINLRTPGARLIGGLSDFFTFFKFNTNPAYTAQSVTAYRESIASGTPNPTLLQQAAFTSVKPEIANSYEAGYRGLLTRNLLIDLYGYMSRYKDFIARVAVARGRSGNAANAPMELASPFTSDQYSFVTNTPTTVKAIGWGISATYRAARGYEINANISSDRLQDVPDNFVTFFNTPKLRYNIGLSNPDVYRNWGFNIICRWQDEVNWEGTFGTGKVPAYGTIDAQVSYRMPTMRSIFKVGASNMLNKYYRSAFGNPEIGGLYYVSFGYNIF